MGSLEQLVLDGNGLSGEIPSEWGGMAALEDLFLRDKRAEREHPAGVGQPGQPGGPVPGGERVHGVHPGGPARHGGARPGDARAAVLRSGWLAAGVDVPTEADRTSTLHGCSVGTDTLTARLYEVHEDDSETERTSVEAEVTVTPPRMYAPAVTAGGGSLDVYWTELSAEHAITRYVVRYKLTADPDVPSSWTPSSPAAASDPKPKTLTGLSNRSYDVQVRGCTQNFTCGPWSDSTPGTPVPVITIEAQQSEVTEGDNVVFTLRADPVPENDLTVRVDVSQMPRGADFLDGAAPTEKTIASGSATAELRVRTDNDDVDEEDGTITVTVQADTGYVIASPPPEASVRVLDNDVQLAAPADLTITPLPLRKARLDWTSVPNASSADNYAITVRKLDARQKAVTPWHSPAVADQTATSAVIILDTIRDNPSPPVGMADLMPGESYEYRIRTIYDRHDSGAADASDP